MDGLSCGNEFLHDKRVLYYVEVARLASEYIRSADTFVQEVCKTSRGEKRREVDTPHGHRFIELSVHTIPIFRTHATVRK